MKRDYWLIAGVILAVGLSSISLAVQIKSKPSKFQKYYGTATEMDNRWADFDVGAIRAVMSFRNGVGVPFIVGFSDDGKKLLVRVVVSSSQMPKDFEQRKYAMLLAAGGDARLGFESGFGDDPNLDFDKDVLVEFPDFDKRSEKDKRGAIVATYENGQLTLH
jgi:hypothetical protein